MIITGLLGAVFCLISGAVLVLASVMPLWSVWLAALVLGALWLGSGCLAATFAELMKRRILPHALLGLCLPYIYPLLLLYGSRNSTIRAEKKQADAAEQQKEQHKAELSSHFQAIQDKRDLARKERIAQHQGISVEEVTAREEARKAAQAAEQVAEQPAEPPPAEAVQPEAAGEHELYTLLFAQEADQNGVRQGPFQFTMASGETIDIDNIRELHPEYMICTISGTGKSVRLKYTQVESIARYEYSEE